MTAALPQQKTSRDYDPLLITSNRGYPAVYHRPRTKETQVKTKEAIRFENALAPLLEQLSHSRQACADLYQYVYSNIRPWGGDETGAEIATRIFTNLDTNYTLFGDEVVFLTKNKNAIERHFLTHFAHNKPFALVSVGCGPQPSVDCKDVFLTRLLGAKKYIAIDAIDEFSQTAARLMSRREPGITTQAITTDFTQPFDLRKETDGYMVIMTILGNTIGQYPHMEQQSSYKGKTLTDLLENLGAAIDYDGVLLASLDVEEDESTLETKYSGTLMRKLKNTFWQTAKAVTGDKEFNPKALCYIPDYDRDSSRLRFAYTAIEPTSLTAAGKRYPIPVGSRIEIGGSQKLKAKSILPVCQATGWLPAPKIEGLVFSNTTRLLSLTGQNTKMLETAQP